MEVQMLTTLFPRACHRHSGLPLLGPIADNFDDWLLDRGYTVTSRTYAIEMLRHIDEDLRRRGIEHVTSLTHSILHHSWRVLIQRFPHEAGTVRGLEQYLKTHNLLNGSDRAEPYREIDVQVTAYADYLQDVRGCCERHNF
jgi:integrase/recombinase XerD